MGAYFNHAMGGKMKNPEEAVLGLIMIIILLIGAFFLMMDLKETHQTELKKLKDKAIELNHAEYDNKTGEWGWK